jgi:NAD-dependent dihydropyrimidine dehydrogenase PreA subunit
MSEHKQESIVEKTVSRRGFLKIGGAAMGTAVLGGVVAGCGDNVTRVVGSSSDNPSTPTTGAMTLEQANALRKKIIDGKGAYTRADGTVVPAVYVKLRTLINSIGIGIGSQVTDTSFDEVMYLFSQDEAQACLEMPIGVIFTAVDFSVASGRTEDACSTICESLASRALLFRAVRAGVPHYHLLTEAYGISEYSILSINKNEPASVPEYLSKNGWAKDGEFPNPVAYFDSNTTPILYTIPVKKEIVTTGQALAYDDYEKIISRNTTIAVAPCVCRLAAKAFGQSDAGTALGIPLETCISTGELAAFHLANGLARQVTQDEALSLFQSNVTAGAVIQNVYSKAAEIICFCHGSYCGVLGNTYLAATGDIDLTNVSHYTLQYNKDACIKCGACVKRCTMFTVKMGTDGYPAVGNRCVRCCQCGTTCPASARKLVLKESYPELPDTILDDENSKGQYNLSRGYIY